MGPDGPKWGGDAFFRHKKNLADILGRTDFDFEIFFGGEFLGPNILAWAHVGPTWAHPLGPRVGPPTKWVGPTWAHPLGPHVGPPTWAQAWAQTPPPAPPPDEFSDPNLTPLPTHPGTKYVARSLAATYHFATANNTIVHRFPR